MQDQTRGEVVPVPRPRRSRRVAVALVAATAVYSCALGAHKAHDHAAPVGSHSEDLLLDNVRSAPRLASRLRIRTRTADDHLDLAVVEGALALLILAAAKLPHGSPARRKLARDAKRLRLELDRLSLA